MNIGKNLVINSNFEIKTTAKPEQNKNIQKEKFNSISSNISNKPNPIETKIVDRNCKQITREEIFAKMDKISNLKEELKSLDSKLAQIKKHDKNQSQIQTEKTETKKKPFITSKNLKDILTFGITKKIRHKKRALIEPKLQNIGNISAENKKVFIDKLMKTPNLDENKIGEETKKLAETLVILEEIEKYISFGKEDNYSHKFSDIFLKISNSESSIDNLKIDISSGIKTSDRKEKLCLETLENLLGFFNKSKNIKIEQEGKKSIISKSNESLKFIEKDLIPSANKVDDNLAEHLNIVIEKSKNNAPDNKDLEKSYEILTILTKSFNASLKMNDLKDPTMLFQGITRAKLMTEILIKEIKKENLKEEEKIIKEKTGKDYSIEETENVMKRCKKRQNDRYIKFFSYKYSNTPISDLTIGDGIENEKTTRTQATKYLQKQKLIGENETVDTYLQNMGITLKNE